MPKIWRPTNVILLHIYDIIRAYKNRILITEIFTQEKEELRIDIKIIKNTCIKNLYKKYNHTKQTDE